jgi:glycosyltransferase involved in cell wall biosynthesis
MGVDVAHFAAASSRHARPHPRRYLLVLGRLAQVKGVDLALEAFAVLRELAARPGSAGDDAPGAPPDAARELAPTAPPAAPDVPAAPAAPAAPADRDARAALIAGDGPERARLQQLADLDLVIAGDGPERPRLQQLAAALPAATAARVRFLGELPAAARDAWLAHAAAVVLPSRRLAGGRGEGTPQVALEALAAGVPLLAAATGGLAALPAPARLLPEAERDPRRWAAALLELLAAASPISADAARAAVAPFDWPDVAAALHAHWLGAR